MKIAITGHTDGIGKAIFDLLKQEHDVLGFSRQNGYDIDIDEHRKNLLAHVAECDVFINNAYSEKQATLLIESIQQWEDKDKLIINVGSKVTMMSFVLPGEENYVEEKRKQEKIVNDRLFMSMPQVTNVIIGLTDTKMTDRLAGKKLNPKDIAETVSFIINNRHKVAIQQIIVEVPNQKYNDITLKY